MAKGKPKHRPKEQKAEARPAGEQPLVPYPPVARPILLIASSVLLALWLAYLLYVALQA